MIKHFLGILFATTTLLVSCSNQQTQTKGASLPDTFLLAPESSSEKIQQNPQALADTSVAKKDSAMTLQQFESLLVTDKYVLIDFYATWCGPCRMMEPALEDIAKTMGDKVTVVRIDVDKNEELSKHFEVESLPTVQIYKNKKLVWEDIGYKTKKQLVNQLK